MKPAGAGIKGNRSGRRENICPVAYGAPVPSSHFARYALSGRMLNLDSALSSQSDLREACACRPVRA
ncbi:hypothetical protein GCM10017621_29160 [Maricaulis virginensis]|uniref:Uncharacterized protein n=1 Tax=Maricaulis virginensis TaxID=144022 RepID=A0A9W6INS6_9PROT|nr:hypothetical protein GCM10017621_29160 [Maricaulis virginensis]